MKSFKKTAMCSAIAALSMGYASLSNAGITEAITSGKTSGNLNLRYENVEVGDESSAGMTLRTRIGYKTGAISGFSAYVEFEDVSNVLGIDDPDGFIPDPEVTEVEQAYLQYKTDAVTAKLGRQVLTLDGHRFLGHVGWRQDRQTFDAARVSFAPMKDLKIDISHIYKRNRIFGESADADSSDNILNISYKTPVGKIVGFGYFLDDETRDEQSDTMGVSFSGATKGKTSFLYSVSLASQDITDSGVEFETDYSNIEFGAKINKKVTVKGGIEVLGSDEGQASFTTPLATLHKFNGWADVFLGGTFNPTAMPLGLVDTYLTVAGKVAGIKLVGSYHMYSSDEDNTSGDSVDYGSEFNFVAAKKFTKNYSAGLKYAAYSVDDSNEGGAAGGADVTKTWLWATMKF